MKPSFDLALSAVKSVQPGPVSPKTRGGRLLMALLAENGMTAPEIHRKTDWSLETIKYHIKTHRVKLIRSDWYAEDYIRIADTYLRLCDAVSQTLAQNKAV